MHNLPCPWRKYPIANRSFRPFNDDFHSLELWPFEWNFWANSRRCAWAFHFTLFPAKASLGMSGFSCRLRNLIGVSTCTHNIVQTPALNERAIVVVLQGMEMTSENNFPLEMMCTMLMVQENRSSSVDCYVSMGNDVRLAAPASIQPNSLETHHFLARAERRAPVHWCVCCFYGHCFAIAFVLLENRVFGISCRLCLTPKRDKGRAEQKKTKRGTIFMTAANSDGFCFSGLRFCSNNWGHKQW